METGGVAGSEEQFRVRRATTSAEFGRDADVGVNQTVEGADVTIAAVACGNGGCCVESFHVDESMWHNWIVQNLKEPTDGAYAQLELDRQLCFPLYAASRAVTARYGQLLGEVNLTYPQYLVMLVLWEESPQYVGDLGRRLRLDSGTLSPLLKRLEVAGLLTRRRDREDERKVSIQLTEDGLRLRERVRHVPGEIAAAVGVDEQTYRQLKAQLSEILCRLSS